MFVNILVNNADIHFSNNTTKLFTPSIFAIYSKIFTWDKYMYIYMYMYVIYTIQTGGILYF